MLTVSIGLLQGILETIWEEESWISLALAKISNTFNSIVECNTKGSTDDDNGCIAYVKFPSSFSEPVLIGIDSYLPCFKSIS